MVTSNKLSDKKVVKMGEHDHNNIAVVVPQRTLLGEVNEHITCPLCRGYYIDATTIVECLHSFCRSCIIKHLQVKSYCPVCEMMINSAKPNIKLDKALQDIVYKLVPGLFQKEMERRQQFYASRPGTAASATPEQRGEDTERIIFSPEDVISFSLEYADLTDADSISSRSSDSNEPQNSPATTRRYLQCPAVVNISHLKKFLSMKFDIDSTQFAIDILYKRVPLSDYYTLMDIAYIFNWKRNEPMRFFYQIIDYVAIRNRLFDINRKGSHFHDRKSSPASTEDTNVSSPAPHLNDQGSEASSGSDSPMPDDSSKHCGDSLNKTDNLGSENKIIPEKSSNSSEMSPKKMDEDVEKSQFLNSFELTPKSNCVPVKSSPSKSTIPDDKSTQLIESTQKTQINLPEKAAKVEEKHPDTLKRKNSSTLGTPEFKKLKVELEKAKISHYINYPGAHQSLSNQPEKSKSENTIGEKQTDGVPKGPQIAPSPSNSTSTSAAKDIKQQHQVATVKQVTENPVMKRPVTVSQNTSSPKRKLFNEGTTSSAQLSSSLTPKAVSPLKLQIPKLENQSSNPNPKPGDIPKPPIKKMPDLKPSGSMSQSSQGKSPVVNKVRMDLLANNSDPTIDRSKILSQVKSSLNVQSTGQASGDPLKSLFDSCKINIPSSLSITLTDQKLDNRVPSDASNVEVKKNIVNKNITAASNISHKVPSPPVHNYIEILKLPDTDAKKQTKSDITSDTKSNPHKLEATTSQPKPNAKTSETSAKGPIPNLKPIADTKLAKQSGSFSAPITFQQTFEQQLQSMQCDKKPKLPKSKTQVPKLVPATPKSLSAVNKPNLPINKPISSNSSTDSKTSTALDLSTPHNLQTQLGSQQTFDKALETMQTIANLAKKQNLPSKGLSVSMTHNNVFPSMANRTMATGVSPLRVPSTNTINQIKLDKMNALATHVSNNSRSDLQNKTNQMKLSNNGSPTMSPLNYPSHASASTAQPSPRSQTRSPSSSPKLVIAEEKQVVNSLTDHTMNQSNQISSTQLTNVNIPKSESPKASPGPSKTGLKPVKPMTSGKVAAIWQPLTPTMKSNQTMSSPSDFLSQQLTRQMEVNAWIKAQRQFEFIKNMSNMAHQTGSDFNNQDKQ